MAHKLLLADDSVTIQRVIELTFADEDVDVTTVGDGQLAIDRLDADPPDIVLADVDMPKRDGYEVAAYVKSRPKLAHIPVVLLTGAFEPIDQARATAAGSSDVLAKPFEPQMVINRVKELLGKKRPGDEGAYSASGFGSSNSTAPQISDPQPAGRESPEDSAQPVSLDDYFDQLDAAFSNLQPGAPAPEADDMDWAAAHETNAPDVASTSAHTIATAEKPVAPTPAAASPVVMVDTRVPAASAPTSPIAPVDEPTFAPMSPIASVDEPTFAPTSPIAPVDKPVAATFAPTAAMDEHVASTFAPMSPNAPADKPDASTFAPMSPIASVDKPVAPVAPIAAPTAPPKLTANPFANLTAAKAEAATRAVAPAITDDVIEEIVSRVLQRMTDRVVRETVTDIVSQTAERLVQEEIEKMKTGS
jgi:CheY-like chemotaxis protein